MIFSSKIEVRPSPIEGFGVFAKEDIFKGEILEESPFIMLPNYILSMKPIIDSLQANNLLNPREKYLDNLRKNLGFKDAEEYYFKWFPKHQLDGEDIVYTILPLGFGPIYNTSNSDNNAEWKMTEKTLIFSANKDIFKDQEICTFYSYFLDEKGTKFECDDVYNFALDYFDGQVGFKSIRFNNQKSHLSAKNNPFFVSIYNLLAKAKPPIRIKNIIAISPDDKEQAHIKIPKDVTLKDLFNKLKECKYSSFPKIGFDFEFWLKDKDGPVSYDINIIWEERIIWTR